MFFNITYGAEVTDAQKNAVNAVATFLDNHFTDNVTVNITVDFGALDPNVLGQSSTARSFQSYDDIRTHLVSDQTTTDDQNAALPTTDPISGDHTYMLSTAQQKALGLFTGASTDSDGGVTFSNAANLFDFDRSDGITAGLYDFAGTVAHEFTEIMGRLLNVNGTVIDTGGTAHPNSNYLMDLHHFSSDGVRSFSRGGYFSIDNGKTDLNDFNPGSKGDAGDWDNTTLVGNDSFRAFSDASVVNPVTLSDFRLMDILGWDLTNHAPTVTALSKSVNQDASFSQSLLEGTADADTDFLTIVNLDKTVTTSGGRTLTLGTDYILQGSSIELTNIGIPKFDPLPAGGTDTVVFHFGVSDFETSTANTLTLTIDGLNDPPVAHPFFGRAGENETKLFDAVVFATDVDIPHTISLDSLGAVTVMSANPKINGIDASSAFSIDSGQIKFTPGTLFDPLALGDTATVVVDYTVKDDQNATSSSTFTLRVDGAEDPPMIQSGGGGDVATYDVRVDFSAITKVVATDVDSGSSLSYSIVGGANQDLFSIDSSTGALAFKVAPIVPHNGYEVLVQASDGTLTDQQLITVNVTSNKMDGDAAKIAADTFVFHSNGGSTYSNSVNNFDVKQDFLQFDKGMFSANTAAAVLAAATDDHKGNTVIVDTAGDHLTLIGVTKADLTAHQNDILFV